MSALTAMMPPVKYADVNGIRMAYYEAGPEGDGVPLVFCHGFPELAFSWRHQIKALSGAGRRVIAPDQRGYGLTDAPAEVESYALENLCADLVALLDARGIEKPSSSATTGAVSSSGTWRSDTRIGSPG